VTIHRVFHAALAAALLAAAPAPAAKITEFVVPTNGSMPAGITAGPDGRLWFCEFGGDKIGAITLGGTITEYPIRQGAGCSGITTAAGLLWYTEQLAGKSGVMSTVGNWLDGGALSSPFGISSGRDGRIWIAQVGAGALYAQPVLTNAPAATTYYTVTNAAGPSSVTPGPDGRVWTTEQIGKIGACDPGGDSCVEFPLPAGSQPYGIAAGSDGALWFTDYGANAIRRITTAGTYTTFPLPTPNAEPAGIVMGADGDLWFTENIGNKIGRIALNGAIVEYPIPTASSFPGWIALGPDGNIWFTEGAGNKVGRVQVFVPGDVNGNGDVEVGDVFHLINFLFAGGPAPK
jgi:streptogramin lyase